MSRICRFSTTVPTADVSRRTSAIGAATSTRSVKRTELQLRVGTALLIHDEHDALHVRLMPRRANLDAPRTGRELRERERAGIAARRRAYFVGRLVHRTDRGAGDNGSGRILHASTDDTAMALRLQSDGQQQRPREQPHRIGNHCESPFVSKLFACDVFK